MAGTKRGDLQPGPSAKTNETPISKSTEKLKAILDKKPGARAEPVPTPRGAPTPAVMYKLMGKMFAILSVRGDAFVIVKSDPMLVDLLRQKYTGVGHRSHLDRRCWISVELDADVPMAEIRKLIEGSYDLIHEKLTKKQKEELAALLQ
jgi:predicted DNA-binding protein (MmcQ/YjbR family)